MKPFAGSMFQNLVFKKCSVRQLLKQQRQAVQCRDGNYNNNYNNNNNNNNNYYYYYNYGYYSPS